MIKYDILPEKELTSIYKRVSLFRFPICVGRDPEKSDNNIFNLKYDLLKGDISL